MQPPRPAGQPWATHWAIACCPSSLRPERSALHSPGVILQDVAAIWQSCTTDGSAQACASAVLAQMSGCDGSQSCLELSEVTHATASAAIFASK